jgi:hypothetical protein
MDTMDLPDYFLADLADPSLLTPAMVGEACRALKSNRRQFLAERDTASIIAAIAALAEDWLDPANPFRRRALEQGPAALGFSPPTLAAGLDAFFGSLTQDHLQALVLQDLGHAQRLDRLMAAEAESFSNRLALAHGPEMLVHITGGRLPNPALTSIVLGLLTRSAQFVKCASGTALLPRLFAHSLREVEPKLGACLEIAEWRGGHRALETALFAEADCVTAAGSDETLTAIRHHLPAGVRFLGYGTRLSFGYVAHEMLSNFALPKVVAAAARDVMAWNQLGCLSPHAIYVETGGRNAPERFAELLAGELAAGELLQPRGPLPTADAAAVAAHRAFYEIRAAHSPDTQLWCSPDSTAWTVVFEADPRFRVSCLNRFIYVKAVADVEQALQGADEWRGRISTVGLAATGAKEQTLAARFARWGVPRICPVGRMQQPPPVWRHDGRPALGDLVTWTDWETAVRNGS